jgi:hypothetical protein
MKATVILFLMIIFSCDPVPAQVINYRSLLVRERNRQENLVINAEYPRFTNTPGSNRVLDIINSKIDSIVFGNINSFKNKAGLNSGFKTDSIAVNNFDLADSVYWANENIISVELDLYKYIIPQAHPENEILTLNFDMRNGNNLQLSNLFKAGFLQVISDFTYRTLIDEFEQIPGVEIDYAWVKRGTEAVEENFRNFVLSNNGLTIIFNNYRVAPYYLGPRKVFIPYLTLAKVWDYSSAIGEYLR